MLEYIFFDEIPCQRFEAFLADRDIPFRRQQDETGFTVLLSEALDDDLIDEVEAEYDRMMDLDSELADSQDEAGAFHAVGLSLRLADGRTVQAEIAPAVMDRMLSVLTPEEIDAFVQAIVDAVEHPDERSICQRHRR